MAASLPPPPALRWSPAPVALAPGDIQPLRVSGARELDLETLRRELLRLLGSDLGVNPRTVKDAQWMFGQMSRVAWAALDQGRPEVEFVVSGQPVCVSSRRLSGEPMTMAPPSKSPAKAPPQATLGPRPVMRPVYPEHADPSPVAAVDPRSAAYVVTPEGRGPGGADWRRPRSPPRPSRRGSPTRSPPRRRPRASSPQAASSRRPTPPRVGGGYRRPVPSGPPVDPRPSGEKARPVTGYGHVRSLPGGRQGRY